MRHKSQLMSRLPLSPQTATRSFFPSPPSFQDPLSQHLKFPTEKGTYFHLAHLKEGIDLHIISRFVWTDTRDMLADGLAKGSIDCCVLDLAMRGVWVVKNPVKMTSAVPNQTML